MQAKVYHHARRQKLVKAQIDAAADDQLPSTALNRLHSHIPYAFSTPSQALSTNIVVVAAVAVDQSAVCITTPRHGKFKL